MTERFELTISSSTWTIIVKKVAYRRSIKMQYHIDGIHITAPRSITKQAIVEFITSHEAWLHKQKQAHANKTVLPTPTDLTSAKLEAKELVLKIIAAHQNTYPFHYKKITIKNIRTKWGSCSNSGNLNFNYRIIYLPKALTEYIVIHEICHLKQLNHSAKFWQLVTKTIPHYRECRKQLKQYYFQLS